MLDETDTRRRRYVQIRQCMKRRQKHDLCALEERFIGDNPSSRLSGNVKATRHAKPAVACSTRVFGLNHSSPATAVVVFIFSRRSLSTVSRGQSDCMPRLCIVRDFLGCTPVRHVVWKRSIACRHPIAHPPVPTSRAAFLTPTRILREQMSIARQSWH